MELVSGVVLAIVTLVGVVGSMTDKSKTEK